MADDKTKLTIKDFSGGLNSIEPDRIAENESSDIQNFVHIEGALSSFPGRVIYNGDPALDTTWNTSGIKSFDIWQKTSQPVNNTNTTTQTQWPVVKLGGALWAHFEVDANGAAYNSGTPIFKPIAVRTTGLEESMSSFGGYAYFANGTDSMIRWDGRSYCVGLCSCAGGTTVTFQASAKLATYDSVREGDTIFFYNATAWTLTAYYVASITDDTHLELTVAGPNTGGNTAYNIVGVHNVGIAKPTEQLTLGINTSSWTMRTIDTDYSVPYESSVGVDSSGNPHIMYETNSNYPTVPSPYLKHSWWDGSIWNTEIVITTASNISGLDMAIDSSNNIHVIYNDSAYLYYIKYTAGAWTVPYLLDTITTSGDWNSFNIVCDGDGHIHCAWIKHDSTVYSLNYTEYTTSWAAITTITVVENPANCSLCVDSTNVPHIAFYTLSSKDLKYTTLSGTWAAATVIDSAGDVGYQCSIATTTTNKPIISYADITNSTLKMATYTTSWATETVDSTCACYPWYKSLTLTTTDLARITYYDSTNKNLKYASWGGAAWTLTTIESAGDVGIYSSHYLDSSNNAHVSYVDKTNKGIKYATLASLGSDLSVGEYKYRYLYKNSNTTYNSALNDTERAITIADLNSTIDITLPATAQNPSDKQVDQIEIYRTKANGSLYYYLTTLNRGEATYVFQSGAWTDSIGDDELAVLVGTDDRTVPPTSIKCIREYNGRMYGWGSDNTLRFSTLNTAEYWPTDEWGVSNPLDIESYQLEGGYITFGNVAIKVLSVTPGLGSGDSSDKRGSVLLVQTENKSYWWSGYDWSDFELSEAYNSTCISSRTTENVKGLIVWMSKQGPIIVANGNLISAFEKMFPSVSNQFEDISSTSYLDKAVAIVWRDYYICAYPGGTNTTNNKCFLLHLPSNTFTTFNHSTNVPTYSDFAIDSQGTLYAADATIGKIWKLFKPTSANTYWSGTAGVGHKWESGLIYNGEPWRNKRIHYARILVDRPATTQQLSLSVTPNDRGTAATAIQKSVASTGQDGRVWLTYPCQKDGYAFKLKVTGTFTVPMKIHMIQLGDFEFKAEVDKTV